MTKDEMESVFKRFESNFSQLMDIQFKNVHERQDETNKQIAKLNGSVASQYERIVRVEKDMAHTLELCPQAKTIQTILDRMVTKSSLRMFFYLLFGLIAATTAIIAVITTIK